MSAFWQGWIIVLSVGNLLACLWLVWWATNKRTAAATGDVMPHTWDGTLQEYNNPLPRWWLWLFYGTIIFGAIYYTLYPGLWDGVLGWTSADKSFTKGDVVSQYEREMQKAEDTYGPIYAKYRSVAVADLAKDAEANGMGKRLFLTYCMQCHGSDAKGSTGFPNLSDSDWTWGGTPEQIQATIAVGRTAAMPPNAHLGEEAIDQVANYVMSLGGRGDPAKAEAGKAVFTSGGCIACHGPDAKGNPMLGAPNLTDNIWLYGASEGVIKKTITGGRNGLMPAHQGLLGEDKIHLLTAYVYSLSNK
ncbi:MAG: cytochrome-c oxidase, cbb3-type subunit III [Gammaproteobacteria bacterium]|nr:cytochrome-c oxidase, cbb3-type subunit III [Gammaproteobacteria bacterium]MBU1655652.1 cytochrome-c oxidase, cbb3-type subunit III [Gammaproteobacteria bacterium]MBU1960305.1 cytochrome-c oxidase, cbb3-type subunit III [Gammaproteobacteria bacterium]